MQVALTSVGRVVNGLGLGCKCVVAGSNICSAYKDTNCSALEKTQKIAASSFVILAHLSLGTSELGYLTKYSEKSFRIICSSSDVCSILSHCPKQDMDKITLFLKTAEIAACSFCNEQQGVMVSDYIRAVELVDQTYPHIRKDLTKDGQEILEYIASFSKKAAEQLNDPENEGFFRKTLRQMAKVQDILEITEVPSIYKEDPFFRDYCCPITKKLIRFIAKVLDHDIYYEFEALKKWSQEEKVPPDKWPDGVEWGLHSIDLFTKEQNRIDRGLKIAIQQARFFSFEG